MAISLKLWLSQFCALHEQYKRNQLDAALLAQYREDCADLGATLVLAQRLEIRTGGARQSVRVARAIPVEFDLRAGRTMALTQDISTTGLSALVGEAPSVGSQLSFRLKLARDVEVIVGRCRVVAAIPTQGSVRMAVSFEEIGESARQRIENVVIDAICAEIRTVLFQGQTPNPPLRRDVDAEN